MSSWSPGAQAPLSPPGRRPSVHFSAPPPQPPPQRPPGHAGYTGYAPQSTPPPAGPKYTPYTPAAPAMTPPAGNLQMRSEPWLGRAPGDELYFAGSGVPDRPGRTVGTWECEKAEHRARVALRKEAVAIFDALYAPMHGIKMEAKKIKRAEREGWKRALLEGVEAVNWEEISRRERMEAAYFAGLRPIFSGLAPLLDNHWEDVAARGKRIRRRQRKLDALKDLHEEELVRTGLHPDTNAYEAGAARIAWEEHDAAEGLRRQCTEGHAFAARRQAFDAFHTQQLAAAPLPVPAHYEGPPHGRGGGLSPPPPSAPPQICDRLSPGPPSGTSMPPVGPPAPAGWGEYAPPTPHGFGAAQQRRAPKAAASPKTAQLLATLYPGALHGPGGAVVLDATEKERIRDTGKALSPPPNRSPSPARLAVAVRTWSPATPPLRQPSVDPQGYTPHTQHLLIRQGLAP